MTMNLIISIIVLNTVTLSAVNGHGMMVDPPGRATRWRFGFRGPPEYTDNQLSCGGRNVQWGKHKGKCGVCGDEYGIPNPKFAYPGAFATNPPIVKVYSEGQKIDVKIRITANHKGYFTFRVAPLVNPPIKQEDLDKTMLELDNGDAEWKLLSSHGNGEFKISLQLPMGLTCRHCVLQWWWTTGNNYINDKPETFVSCADIEIRSRGGPRPSSKPKPKPTTRERPATLPPSPKPTETPSLPSGNGCRSYGERQSASMDQWCRMNCSKGFCPPSFCTCA